MAKKKKKPVSSSAGRPAARSGKVWLAAAALALALGAAYWWSVRTPKLELPYLTARHVAVMDLDTGKFVYEKDIDTPRSPSSLTKLMTLFLVLDDIQSGTLDWDDTFQVTPAQANAQGSKYGMKPGEVFTVRQLVAGTVMCSGCDCVQCLVLMCAPDEAAFVERMNARAQELGLEGTHYINATGIDASAHYMTAGDIASLASALLQAHPELLDFTSVPTLKVGERTFQNTHLLVGRDDRVKGLKTGTTLIGGYNLVTLAQEGDKSYLIVLLDSNSAQIRFSETRTVTDALFEEG